MVRFLQYIPKEIIEGNINSNEMKIRLKNGRSPMCAKRANCAKNFVSHSCLIIFEMTHCAKVCAKDVLKTLSTWMFSTISTFSTKGKQKGSPERLPNFLAPPAWVVTV